MQDLEPASSAPVPTGQLEAIVWYSVGFVQASCGLDLRHGGQEFGRVVLEIPGGLRKHLLYRVFGLAPRL